MLSQPGQTTDEPPSARTHYLVFFNVVLALVFVLLVYESALFKARAHTEMPVLVLFYFLIYENDPCPFEAIRQMWACIRHNFQEKWCWSGIGFSTSLSLQTFPREKRYPETHPCDEMLSRVSLERLGVKGSVRCLLKLFHPGRSS